MIDRVQEGGVWRYGDQREHEFIFVMEQFGIPMSSVDDFIEGRQGAQLRDDERADLLDERSEALSAYISGDFELAKARAIALHRSCCYVGLHFAAVPLARKALVTKQSLSKGGKKAAAERKQEAAGRLKSLRAAAAKLEATEPSIKKEAVAATLADRGLGGKEAIAKLLRSSKKSSEGN